MITHHIQPLLGRYVRSCILAHVFRNLKFSNLATVLWLCLNGISMDKPKHISQSLLVFILLGISMRNVAIYEQGSPNMIILYTCILWHVLSVN